MPSAGGRALRVWIVDDHAALRDLFSRSLNQRDGIHCTRTFATGGELLATLEEERPPDLILLDINLGRECGLDLIKPIRKLAPPVKVVMFTMFRNVHCAAEAFRSGASGFLLKTYEIADLVRLIRGIHDGSGHTGMPSPGADDDGSAPGQTIPGTVAARSRFNPVGALRHLFGSTGSRLAH